MQKSLIASVLTLISSIGLSYGQEFDCDAFVESTYRYANSLQEENPPETSKTLVAYVLHHHFQEVGRRNGCPSENFRTLSQRSMDELRPSAINYVLKLFSITFPPPTGGNAFGAGSGQATIKSTFPALQPIALTTPDGATVHVFTIRVGNGGDSNMTTPGEKALQSIADNKINIDPALRDVLSSQATAEKLSLQINDFYQRRLTDWTAFDTQADNPDDLASDFWYGLYGQLDDQMEPDLMSLSPGKKKKALEEIELLLQREYAPIRAEVTMETMADIQRQLEQ